MRFRKFAHCLATVSAVALYASLPSAAIAQTDSETGVTEGKAEAPADAAVNGWGQKVDEIQADPATIFGTLPNGMKYAIKPNGAPKGGVSVRFGFNVGFAAEADEDEGLAHFVEHMAFNGSAQIPEGELIQKLERLGLAFGADTNAMTTVHETVYKLDAPRADAETLDAVLTIMRETASELTISQAAVDRERGILLAEKSSRNDASRRDLTTWLKNALPETPVGTRLSGGSEQVLKNATAAQIRTFYHKFYRPEKATLVVVGDIDPAAIEKQIRERFSNWQPVGPAGTMDMGKVNPNAPASITTFDDPSTNVLVRLTRMLPYSKSANTLAEQKSSYLETLASLMLSKRLAALATAQDSKVLGGGSQREDLFQAAKLVGTIMYAKGDDWQSALAASEQELRRALQFGFTAGELADIHATISAGLRNAAEQKDSAASANLAESLIKSAHEGFVFTTPQADLALYEKLLPELTVDNINAAFRQMWGNGANAIYVATKAPITDGQNAVMAALGDSAKVAVLPPVDVEAKAFAYNDFGKPGKVVSDKMIADLGIRTVRFANGTLLNIKKTAFEPGKIQFALRAGSGQAVIPADKPGLAAMMTFLSPFDGLKEHGYDELQKILAGKTVSLGLAAEADRFTKNGATTPGDLELQLKLLAATLTDFGYRAETQAQWPGIAEIFATQFSATPAAVALNILPNVLAGGDSRIGIGNPADFAQRSMGELKAAIDADIKKGPIEIALIGDVDENAAIAMVGRTLGALPKRAKAKAVASKVSFTADRNARTLVHNGSNDQGAIAFAWPTTDDSDQKSSLTRLLLGNILGLKLNEIIREKLGATYSPAPLMEASDVYDGFGYVGAWMVADPAKMDEVSTAVKAIVAELRDTPVSEDLLLRARKPNIENFLKQDQGNAGWGYVASVAQSKPERLERRRKRVAVLEAITPTDIQNAAKSYMADTALLEVRILSQETAKALAPAAP